MNLFFHNQSIKIMEIIKQIMDKTGISEEQAKGAVDTVIEFLKDKLPGGVGDHLGDVFAGKSLSMSDLANDKIEDLKEIAADKLGDLKDAANGLMDKLF